VINMDLKQLLIPAHILIAILFISLILIQSKGVGLGTTFGGGDFYRTKRGVERVVFILTIVLAVLFSITSFLSFLYL